MNSNLPPEIVSQLLMEHPEGDVGQMVGADPDAMMGGLFGDTYKPAGVQKQAMMMDPMKDQLLMQKAMHGSKKDGLKDAEQEMEYNLRNYNPAAELSHGFGGPDQHVSKTGDVVPLPINPYGAASQNWVEHLKNETMKRNPNKNLDQVNQAMDKYFGGGAQIIPLNPGK